jgi:subtilase family serine protease
MKNLLYCIALLLLSVNTSAQTPQVPSGKPGRVPLPNPTLHAPKPDLIITAMNTLSITEQPATHTFLITMRVTVKNVGAVTANGSYLDLRSSYGTTSGGTDYSRIGEKVFWGTLYRGESRSVRVSFSKDITALGRARLECFLRIDCDNTVAESNEDNNGWPAFYVTPPSR